MGYIPVQTPPGRAPRTAWRNCEQSWETPYVAPPGYMRITKADLTDGIDHPVTITRATPKQPIRRQELTPSQKLSEGVA